MKYQGFALDRFQQESVRAIDEGKSLIVAAPTGCGKTLIAEYAVDVSLAEGHRVVYTAPIKALSNQKFRDFRRRFGDKTVGIQTGDVTINQDAPLLIMTTEIFRNQILENASRLDDVYYTVFDEIHFLDDPDRGTVWEESIILAPRHIRFMCLSATVPNLAELAHWMGQVRETAFAVIEETHRPIPLRHHLFSAKYGPITIKGVRKLYKKKLSERKRFLRQKPSSNRIVRHVLSAGNFPVLYFCFNRRACERNAERHARLHLLTRAERDRLGEMTDALVRQYRLEEYERLGSMRRLWESGCAYHHAGILPAAKEIVEQLFTTGLIKLLFCTETFALGINMPASSVIFDELEKFNGVEFSYLMTRHYNQMAGRAGRRGMDEVGHVYSLIVPEATDPAQVERIMYGTNERIQSRFFASYATILSLYSQYGEGCYDIFRKSLSNWKKGSFSYTKAYRRQEDQIRNRIAFLQAAGFLEGTELTKKGALAAAVSGYEIQAAELYYARSFDECSVRQIPVVLAGLITEEGSSRKRKPVTDFRLRFGAEKVIAKLRKMEARFGIAPTISELDLSLAAPVFAWAGGCTLSDLSSFGVPEGDLIRLLRMTVQLLRVLRDALDDPVITERMHEALTLINRDAVDAQAELETGARLAQADSAAQTPPLPPEQS
jgi:superfamily II RNA helicase